MQKTIMDLNDEVVRILVLVFFVFPVFISPYLSITGDIEFNSGNN